jgi:hypothetical protein
VFMRTVLPTPLPLDLGAAHAFHTL